MTRVAEARVAEARAMPATALGVRVAVVVEEER